MTTEPSSSEFARTVADLAYDRKAEAICTLDIAAQSAVADHFVVCTGRSHIHVRAIAERVEREIKQAFSRRPLSIEGLDTSRWVLVDYGDVVLHVFQAAERSLYDLERLWSGAPRWNYEEGSAKEHASV